MPNINLYDIFKTCVGNIFYNSNESNQKKLIDSIDDNLFKSIFHKYVEASYLSHWKSTIENLVLQNRQRQLQNNLFDNTDFNKLFKVILDENNIDNLLNNISSLDDSLKESFKTIFCRDFNKTSSYIKRIILNSLYKIIIIQDDIDIPAMYSPDSNFFTDIIFIKKDMSIEEKRIIIAHELGHIIINRILKENNSFTIDWNIVNEENFSNLFMYYILYDKSCFYSNKDYLNNFMKNSALDFKISYENILSKYS
ncbi:ImmA/IrrE family metallo-endopeptidase [Brachyspira hyodysenteriae]|uniref:ImmA/IrrE family metallo-endopeptidase n=1 Tax=Brachyspira hyodysenteriae TaxID=159 RepID=UPI0022CD8112|nr:ImmA/IrrE family metallo-endopeptidase [Brachyspira hyodysenteriae]MCZ9956149.1 ImmA/IrrE family metallo-endopeptidase [Brachyspira hyodysenteriae]